MMNDDYQKFIERLVQGHRKTLHHSIDVHYMQTLYAELVKFAENQLQNHAWAEDAVQECLISAMQYSDNFKGNSAFKSWVFAILKHKISDIIRKNQKYVAMSEFNQEEYNDFDFNDLVFSEKGKWQKDYLPISFDDSWNNPELQVENKYFWQILEYCLNHLAGEQARVFLMKEYVGLESKEICQSLKISQQNYYVLMHRARLQLQVCLTRHWFDE